MGNFQPCSVTKFVIWSNYSGFKFCNLLPSNILGNVKLLVCTAQVFEITAVVRSYCNLRDLHRVSPYRILSRRVEAIHMSEAAIVSRKACNGICHLWSVAGYEIYISGPFNSSPPGQNGWDVVDDILKSIFLNEVFFFFIEISLKFVTKGPIDNDPALV